LKTLLKSDKDDRLNLLFVGPPGVGKTTLALIFSKEFGVPEHNIHQYNCFHFSGIENLRSTIETLALPSIFGEKKAVIFDEIHGLSKQAQQELLIPLETLPSSIIIIACTTALEKVNEALLSRFVRFNLKPLKRKEISRLIEVICKNENISLKKPVKAILLEAAEGIPRRILTNILKIHSMTDLDEIKYQLELSKLEEEGSVFDFFKLLLSKNGAYWETVKSELDKVMKEHGPEKLRYSLINLTIARLSLKYKDSVEMRKLLVNFLDNLTSYWSSNEVVGKSKLIVALYKFVEERGTVINY